MISISFVSQEKSYALRNRRIIPAVLGTVFPKSPMTIRPVTVKKITSMGQSVNNWSNIRTQTYVMSAFFLDTNKTKEIMPTKYTDIKLKSNFG